MSMVFVRRGIAVCGSAVLLAALALALAGAGPAPAAPGPTEMVTRFHEALVRAAKSASGKDYMGQRAAFEPVVAEHYDTRFMARIAVGSYWGALSDDEREELAKAFFDLTVASYATRFRGLSSQSFSVLAEQPAPQDRVLVRARIARRAGAPINIGYLLQKSSTPSGWAIIDVWLNNQVSELALRRAEFSPVLREKGGAALIADLKSKIAALPKDPAQRRTHTN